MKINQIFLGGGGVQNKNLPWGEYGYFLELNIFRRTGHNNPYNFARQRRNKVIMRLSPL